MKNCLADKPDLEQHAHGCCWLPR